MTDNIYLFVVHIEYIYREKIFNEIAAVNGEFDDQTGLNKMKSPPL